MIFLPDTVFKPEFGSALFVYAPQKESRLILVKWPYSYVINVCVSLYKYVYKSIIHARIQNFLSEGIQL